MELFKLVGRILVDNKEADNSISKTEKKAGGLASGLVKVAKGAAVVGGAVLAAGGAIMKLATKGAETTDRIDKLSQRLNLSREGFQEWDYVLSQAGVSIDSMQNGMKTMSQRMNDALEGTGKGVELFDKLGVSIHNSAGEIKSQEQVFNESIEALQGMEDGIAKADLAQELFGRNGQDLLPLLNSEAASVEELKNKAHELGLVLGDDVIDAGVNLTDTMDTLKKSSSSALMPIIAGIMPIVEQVAALIIQYIPKIMQMLQPVFDNLMPIITDLVMSLMPMIITLLNMVLGDILPAIMPLLEVIVKKLLPPIIDLIGMLGKTIGPLLADILVKLVEVLTPFIEILAELLDFILPPLMLIIEAVAMVLGDVLGAAFEALMPYIDNVIGYFTNLIEFITNVFSGNWADAWQNVIGIFENIFGAIVNFVKAPINFVIGLINKLFERISSISLPDWLGGGSIDIDPIPLLAKGGTATAPGWSIVGDEGPELINMPKGATVIPLNNEEPPGGNVEQNFNFYSDTSPYGVMRAAKKASQLIALKVH